ncbi:MAG: polysaccharide biosynthesis/export family protein [Chthoniobacterales bacterium]
MKNINYSFLWAFVVLFVAASLTLDAKAQIHNNNAGASGSVPRAQAVSPPSAVPVGQAAAPPAGFADNNGSAVPLRAGDVIYVRIAGVPMAETQFFTGTYTVDPEGYVNMPYIGNVKAAGLLQNELQDLMQKTYKERGIYTNPSIMINFPGVSRFVNVEGDVRRPNRIGFTPDMTLMSALIAAGGLTDFADQKKIQLIRDGKSQFYDIRKIRRNPTLDVPVKPGDMIFVPRSFF